MINLQLSVSQQQPPKTKKTILDYSYSLRNKLGQGFSSTVFRGTHQVSGQAVAVKVVQHQFLADQWSKNALQKQIKCMSMLDNQHILKLLDVFSTANNTYLITEFCQNGDLQNYIKDKNPQIDECLQIFGQIAVGFIHMAQQNIVHRDLKPANILISKKCYKIADFGFATQITNKAEQYMVGSPLYLCPQALEQSLYSQQADIWALGVMLYQMLMGRTPWSGQNEQQLLQNIKKKPIVFQKSINSQAAQFINQCLKFSRRERLNLSKFKYHSFVRKIIGQRVSTAPLLNQKVQLMKQHVLSFNFCRLIKKTFLKLQLLGDQCKLISRSLQILLRNRVKSLRERLISSKQDQFFATLRTRVEQYYRMTEHIKPCKIDYEIIFQFLQNIVQKQIDEMATVLDVMIFVLAQRKERPKYWSLIRQLRSQEEFKGWRTAQKRISNLKSVYLPSE